MSFDLPTVSVVLPVYNGGRYIRVAINSILRQTFPDFELIIIDDGSTDSTPRILRRMARRDTRMVVIRRPNGGIVDALNAGLAVSRGQFIARMDADDISLPGRLGAQVDFLLNNPDILACGTAAKLIDSGGAIVNNYPRPLTHLEIDHALLRGDGSAIIHPTLMVRENAIRQIGGYRKFAQFTEDLDLYLRLSEYGALANLPTSHLLYRIHFESTNFTRIGVKRQVKEAVMRDACRRRHLNFDETSVDLNHCMKSPVRFHREWAESASRLGLPGTALKHALIGATKAPSDRNSYAVLHLVLHRLLLSHGHFLRFKRPAATL